MTTLIEREALNAANGTGPQHARAEQPRLQPHPAPLPALGEIVAQLAGNPLIAAITSHPGMGQHLGDRDIDTVMRVIASIEAARIEVPTRYEQAAANRAALQDAQQP